MIKIEGIVLYTLVSMGKEFENCYRDPHRIIELDEYYKLGGGAIEVIRSLIFQLYHQLPEKRRKPHDIVRNFFCGNDFDDALTLLGAASECNPDDEFSPQTLHMIIRHPVRGLLSPLCGAARALGNEHPVGVRVNQLVSRASILTYFYKDRVALKDILFKE